MPAIALVEAGQLEVAGIGAVGHYISKYRRPHAFSPLARGLLPGNCSYCGALRCLKELIDEQGKTGRRPARAYRLEVDETDRQAVARSGREGAAAWRR